MEKKSKVLIIKVGYSETLDPEVSSITSYGDVLRTTVLLHLHKDDHVTWLVDEKAYPILKGNPYIDRILIYNVSSALQLQAEHFDTVINLEKVPGLCALTDSVRAWRRYGFRFDERTGSAEAYDGTQEILAVCLDQEMKKKHASYWQEGLYAMVNARWKDEEYVLGWEPATEVTTDVGFNYLVGNKWSSKAWPMEYWKQLETLIGDSRSVSWQQGLEDMEEYFEWIHSCRVIVTNDTLGMHLGIAMKKYVIGLFGPTNQCEVCLYGRGTVVLPRKVACGDAPCCASSCSVGDPCMKEIQPEDVLQEIEKAFKESTV